MGTRPALIFLYFVEDVRPITIVNEELQDEFFVETKKELRGVDSFYRTRETQSSLRMRELCEEVEIFIALKANKRTRNLRSTRNKLESLKNAVTEFYLSLSLLQNFQQLNYSGFRKVLKKHDKLACSDRGKRFLNDEVCESHFWRCKKILNDLIEQTENLMIDKLENGNRSKAMNKLRLPSFEKREVRSHWVTCGCSSSSKGFMEVSGPHHQGTENRLHAGTDFFCSICPC